MIRPVKVAASILSADFNCLGEEIERVTGGGADWIHVDVMDGHYVPNITIGPDVIKVIRRPCRLPFDVHLMIENPEKYIESFIEAGADFLTIHQEATVHLQKVVKSIQARGVKAGVAINPATPLSSLEEILPECDLVLIMSVNPGFGGQEFIMSSVDKIRRLRKLIDDRGRDVLLEVDGGINPENSRVVREAGTDIIVSGSAIFNSRPYSKTIALLKNTEE